MKQIVIMRLEAKDLIDNYHWGCCSTDGKPKEFWEMLGHTVIEVSEEKYDQLMKQMAVSISMQLELSMNYNHAKHPDKYPSR